MNPRAAPRLVGDISAYLISLLLDKDSTEQMTSFIEHMTSTCTVLGDEGRWGVVWFLAVI